jgi:hypothetical protein
MGVVPAAEAQKLLGEPGPAEGWPAVALMVRHTIKAPITISAVEEHAADLPELVADPAMAEEIRRAIEVKSVRISSAAPGAQTQVSVDYRIRRKPPMPVVFDILVRINGEEWRVGSCQASGSGHGSSSNRPRIPVPPQDVVAAEVVFRTALNQEHELSVPAVWDGEITYKDVPLVREDPGARFPGPQR